MANTNGDDIRRTLSGNKRVDGLFEGLELSHKERALGCSVAAYLEKVGTKTAAGLMDKVVDVRVIALDPEERSGRPIDSDINCGELRTLMNLSLGYTKAVMDEGWRHSEEQEAEKVRSAVMGWFDTADVENVIANMGTDFCEFLVRLSRWARV